MSPQLAATSPVQKSLSARTNSKLFQKGANHKNTKLGTAKLQSSGDEWLKLTWTTTT
jgi:hypothetical protein